MLTTADVAAILGVLPQTIKQYRSDAKNGRRYSNHPFPEPVRIVGRSPLWDESQREEIAEWGAARAIKPAKSDL